MLWLKDDLHSRKLIVYRAMMFSLVTLFVLFVFQPFGTINDTSSYKILRLSGYGLVTFVALLLSGFIEIALLRYDFYKPLRIMLISGFYILICALFNHAYFVVAFLGQWHWQNQMLFIGYIFAIGVFPLIFMYMLNRHVSQLNIDETPQRQQIKQCEALPLELEQITLVGDNKNDAISIVLERVLFIKAADNYCEISVYDGHAIQQTLLRISLTRLLKQLSINTAIIRCHRSYAVNVAFIHSYSGNAGGLQLTLKNTPMPVPVSRSYVDNIKAALLLTPSAC